MTPAHCTDCTRERELQTEGRLARMEARLEAIDEKLDEAILSQLKDHGKRLASLERRNWWTTGWIAGAALAGSLAARFLDAVRLQGPL